ncbi:hypothetical protein [Polaribacter aestuariivivens]|uniref:hypothetical protein n=1 Tax=Polaribacter aestuariivivens TaxID=2304626 RepID=UPI003F497C4B
MSKEKPKVLHFIKAKGVNKRIEIILYDFGEKGKTFRVFTKTLIDFKKRKILTTDNAYSIETFAVLSELFSYFLDNSEIKNKILMKDLSKIKQFKSFGTFK